MGIPNNPIKLPQYNNSILSVSASLAQYYGIKTSYKTLAVLDKELEKDYKNIILFVCDGLGVNVLEHHLPFDSFLRVNQCDTISSVFPPTTAAATTSVLSVKTPIEHGWLGWACWFEQYQKCVELFLGTDLYTGEKVPFFDSGFNQMPYDSLWTMISHHNQDVQAQVVYPDKIARNGLKSLHQMTVRLQDITRQGGRQFVYAYWQEPDSSSHKNGPYHSIVQKKVGVINKRLKKMVSQLEDTLLIVTADHGHIEINGYIYINDCGRMVDCLLKPLSIEDRCVSCFVKSDMKEIFEQEFQHYLSQDFLLLTREQVLSAHLFGEGVKHTLTDDMIGDYLLIGITDKCLVQKMPHGRDFFICKGAHAGLTQDEMTVPLILIPSLDKR